MHLRPLNRSRRRPDRPWIWAAWLAGLCIAVFECSRLVHPTGGTPSWADARALVAAAESPPGGAPTAPRARV